MGLIQYEVPNNVQRMTIGVQGEANVREFLFDVTEWRQITGDIGSAEMVVQRNGDSSPYAAAITMHDENTVSWIPTAADTEKAGAGKLQLMWMADGQTVKTKIFDMKVDPALDYQLPDDSLDPWASWIPDVINAGAKVKEIGPEVDELEQMVQRETFARTAADEQLNARIDGIIAPTGEAPSAAEVLDARTGADGINYATLGEAVREQVSSSERIQSNGDPMSQMAVFPAKDLITGAGITATTGARKDQSYSAILSSFDLHYYDKLVSKSNYVFLFYGYDCGTEETWTHNEMDSSKYRGYLANAKGDLTTNLPAFWTNELDVKTLLLRYPTYYWRVVVKRSNNSGTISLSNVQNNYEFMKRDGTLSRLQAAFDRVPGGPSGLKNAKLSAHRGFNAEAPGNSVPAFELAGKYGFWAIETDFRMTSDGAIVCMHDETIDSTTDGTGAVASMTAAQLAQYHIDVGAHVSDYTPQELRIPTIDDYFWVCRKYGVIPFIEIKVTGIVDTVLDKLKKYGLYNTAIISSDIVSILQEVRAKSDIFVHWIRMSQTEYDARVMSSLGNSGESYNYTNLDAVPSDLCEKMNKVGVAYCFRAADTVADVVRQAELGVYYIPTNTVKPSDVVAN